MHFTIMLTNELSYQVQNILFLKSVNIIENFLIYLKYWHKSLLKPSCKMAAQILK